MPRTRHRRPEHCTKGNLLCATPCCHPWAFAPWTTCRVSSASLGPWGGDSDANETSCMAIARPAMGHDQTHDTAYHCFHVEQP
jgi:hypothetical protein